MGRISRLETIMFKVSRIGSYFLGILEITPDFLPGLRHRFMERTRLRREYQISGFRYKDAALYNSSFFFALSAVCAPCTIQVLYTLSALYAPYALYALAFRTLNVLNLFAALPISEDSFRFMANDECIRT